MRWGLEDEGLEPVTVAALRYGMAAIVLVGWVIARDGHRRGRPPRGDAEPGPLGLPGIALVSGGVYLVQAARRTRAQAALRRSPGPGPGLRG